MQIICREGLVKNMDLVEQLDSIFYPRAIAVVGVSDDTGKMGHSCVKSLIDAGFKGMVYPVNPSLSTLFGLKVYPSITAIPGKVDLVIIVIPAHLILPVMEECVVKGVKGVIIITSGFKEMGTGVGFDLQNKIRDIANNGRMKIIGPNCLGVINPRANLNATFRTEYGSAKVGNVAVVAQSGGVCGLIVFDLTDHNVGISKAISMGNRCNLDFAEMVKYLGEDEETKVIVMYIEGLEEPRRFMDITRQVVKRKPIIAYKGGRGEGLNQATLSHTGALAGKYEIYQAAFTQAGIITVGDITEMVDITKALTFQPPSTGDRVALFSIQAGPGIIMGDRCNELGLRLADFSTATRERLRQLASPLNPVNNPVDVGGRGDDFDACREMLKVVLEDDGVDAVSVNTFVDMGLTKAVAEISKCYSKPITVCLYPVAVGADYPYSTGLEENNVPTYPFPERAITGLAGLIKYGRILETTS